MPDGSFASALSDVCEGSSEGLDKFSSVGTVAVDSVTVGSACWVDSRLDSGNEKRRRKGYLLP